MFDESRVSRSRLFFWSHTKEGLDPRFLIYLCPDEAILLFRCVTSIHEFKNLISPLQRRMDFLCGLDVGVCICVRNTRKRRVGRRGDISWSKKHKTVESRLHYKFRNVYRDVIIKTNSDMLHFNMWNWIQNGEFIRCSIMQVQLICSSLKASLTILSGINLIRKYQLCLLLQWRNTSPFLMQLDNKNFVFNRDCTDQPDTNNNIINKPVSNTRFTIGNCYIM